MMTHFEEINRQDVKELFPPFYDRQGRFFEILHKNQEIGFVGVRPVQSEGLQAMGNNTCELEVYIFPQYRNTLTKGLVFDVLDFPRTLHFKRSIMKTTRPSLLKLFQTLNKGGKIDLIVKDGKSYYIREYS